MPKPFDLKQALAGKPVLGPDGKPVRRLIHVPEAVGCKVLVVTESGVVIWADEQGHTSWGNPLTMADPPKKKVDGWINVYKRKGRYQVGPAALAGKPVLGPDGRRIQRLIHVPEKCDVWRILVVMADGTIAWFCEDDRRLTMADPPKRRVEGWVNVHKGTGFGFHPGGWFYKSQEKARNTVMDNGGVVAQARVTFEVEDEE